MALSSILRLSVLVPVIGLYSGCTLSHRTDETGANLHQVGLVWLKNAGNKDDQQKVIEAIHAFGRGIPEVKRALVGRTDGVGGPYSDTSYDISFVLSFESEAARQRYNVHPIHEKAAREVLLPLSKKVLFYRFVGE